tara:strand:+ start:431 stop:736 length:306 start_codon:yes stop_codon:yes gene_type:complete
MAITKTLVDDKIEVVGDYKAIQIRTATIIKEDSTEIGKSFARRVLQCGTLNNATDEFTATDTSSESAEIKGIANTVWTDAIRDAYKAHLIATKPPAGSGDS